MFLFNFLLHCLHSLHNLFPLHPFPSRLSCLLCLRILLQFVFSFMLMTQNTNDTEGSCRLKENSVLFFLASLYPQMPLVCLSPFPTSSLPPSSSSLSLSSFPFHLIPLLSLSLSSCHTLHFSLPPSFQLSYSLPLSPHRNCWVIPLTGTAQLIRLNSF